jgi:AraC family transcriptional regulator
MTGPNRLPNRPAVRIHGGRQLARRDRQWNGLRLELARWEVGAATEGFTRLPEHLLFVTFSGVTARTEAVLEGGQRYVGADFPGAITFIPAHHERRARHHDGLLDYAAIRLDRQPPLPEESIDYLGFTNQPDTFVQQVALALREEAVAPGPGGSLLVDSLSTALALHLVRRYSTAARRQPRSRPALTGGRLARIVGYVHDNLASDLRLAALARLAGMDVHQFGRAFKAATGRSPHRYVMECRVDRAAELLTHTTVPISDIAYRVGMSSQSHLTTAFRRATGTTPYAYRAARS